MASREALKLALRAQTDPVWWMEQGCGWKLWSRQQDVAKALVTHERVAVPAAFGVGKSYFAARAALWWLYSHKPSKVISTAPTLRQTRDILWSELRSAHRKSKRPLGGDPLTLTLRLEEDRFALGFATDPDKIDQFTGYHSPHMLVIFDQASGVHRVVWQAAEGLMTGGHARWLAISNTTDSTSAFAEICQAGDGEKTQFGKWKIVKITAYDSPNVVAKCDLIPGIISHDWIEKKREVWDPGDPMWKIFVEAEFVDEAQMVILSGDIIRFMLNSDLAPDYSHITVGLDVADEGLDSTVWTVRAGPRLLFIDQVYGNDPMQVSAHTFKVMERCKSLCGVEPHAVLVDRIGPGSGVFARLRELNVNVFPVNVSMAPMKDTEQFLNLRAELGWTIRELGEAKGVCLKPLFPTPEKYIDSLKEELTIRYKILSSGKIQMEPKKEVRKRLQRSPDFWDSMMLAFADEYNSPGVSLATAADVRVVDNTPDGPISMARAMQLLHGWEAEEELMYSGAVMQMTRDEDGFLHTEVYHG